MLSLCCLWLGLFAIVAEATLYEFVVDNDKIFDKCPEIPDNNGVNDFADLSDVNIEFQENSIVVSGNFTIVWEGVQPTDRVQVS